MNKWIRIAALAVSFIVAIIIEYFDGADLVEYIPMFCTFALAAYCAWKNNDFTWAAKVGTKVMLALKDGKVTEDEVKGILENDERKESS